MVGSNNIKKFSLNKISSLNLMNRKKHLLEEVTQKISIYSSSDMIIIEDTCLKRVLKSNIFLLVRKNQFNHQ